MRKLKKTHEFDNDWNDLSLFEKLPVHNTAGKPKRDDWKRERKALRKAKQERQYVLINQHTA
jgi:hypothetical protein